MREFENFRSSGMWLRLLNICDITSDSGHLFVGALIGSTTGWIYHEFEDIPVKFCVANNEFIFDGGNLGGKYDMTYDSSSGLHILNFLLYPASP